MGHGVLPVFLLVGAGKSTLATCSQLKSEESAIISVMLTRCLKIMKKIRLSVKSSTANAGSNNSSLSISLRKFDQADPECSRPTPGLRTRCGEVGPGERPATAGPFRRRSSLMQWTAGWGHHVDCRSVLFGLQVSVLLKLEIPIASRFPRVMRLCLSHAHSCSPNRNIYRLHHLL